MSPPRFEQLFGHAASVHARAPGRVNLIGEHTDYNGGYVLPLAIPQQTQVELRPREDALVRAASANVDGHGARGEYRLGAEAKGQGWIDYVQGVTHVLRASGRTVRGFDVLLRSDVPLGSGLSSSAALEVALLRALREAFELDLDDVQLALLGQKVETDFVGAPIGVMDQMASSLASEHEALFIDTRTLHHERVALPPGLELGVINSGVTHSHAGGEYGKRRAECEQAARRLGVEALRDLTDADLPRAMALPEPLGRRVRHVVTENDRVLLMVDALRAGDIPRLGPLMFASHASMRDDYEVSVPEIDQLVEIALSEEGVLGARLTGGGFGGSIVLLARPGAAFGATRRAAERYAQRSGQRPAVLVPPS